VKRTILLADDSPTIQRLITQIFADPEFRIVSVSNGDAALRKFEEIEPDIVLADIYMPGKNGYEVCAYVKGRSAERSTPVVLLVGAFDAFDESTAARAGAAAHITKPFEPQALLNLVISLMPGGKTGTRRSAAEAEAEVASSPAATVGAAAAPVPALSGKAQTAARVEEPAVAASGVAAAEDPDLLGLNDLFKPPAAEPPQSQPVSDAEIDRIAERVLQKLSAQVIENVAWDVVPDITSKVLRDELKRNS
jgi:CheY-like chemotaxis protein